MTASAGPRPAPAWRRAWSGLFGDSFSSVGFGELSEAARVRGRPSLVRRLIWLAAVWSLLVILGAGIALTTFFQRAALSRFDQSLYDITEGLYAGTTVEGGQVVAPAFTDTQALRVYSGRYWEIAEVSGAGMLHDLQGSRSLWDSELKPPPDGTARLKPGVRVRYATVGPVGERSSAAMKITGVLRPGRVRVRATTRSGSFRGPEVL